MEKNLNLFFAREANAMRYITFPLFNAKNTLKARKRTFVRVKRD